ncbi:MAG TPA: hypothetical protein VF787_03425 [Thermoanaerobaculia bacterium]
MTTPLADQLKELHAERSDDIAAARAVTPKYVRRSRIRHWWESKKGEWRNQLREWLGIPAIEEGLTEAAPMRLFTPIVKDVADLRTDLDQTDVDHTETRQRLVAAEQGLAETGRRLKIVEQQVALFDRLFRAYATVPMLSLAWKRYQQNERIEADRQQRRAARLMQNGDALRGGETKPDGEGWEPLTCTECGKTAGWFQTRQAVVARPTGAKCKSCTEKTMTVVEGVPAAVVNEPVESAAEHDGPQSD